MTEKQLFISWSKPSSGEIAMKLCEIIEALPLSVRCWISRRAADLPQGPYDHHRIVQAAQDSFACLSVLTPGNILSPWIFFESGVFYGQNKPNFSILSCGITHADMKRLNNPIEGYSAYADRIDSFLDLIRSINSAANNIAETRFIDRATAMYPELKLTHENACKAHQDLMIQDENTLMSSILGGKQSSQ